MMNDRADRIKGVITTLSSTCFAPHQIFQMENRILEQRQSRAREETRPEKRYSLKFVHVWDLKIQTKESIPAFACDGIPTAPLNKRKYMKIKTTVLISAVMALGLLIGACGASATEAAPTLSVEAIQTNAVSTFSGGLTQTALAAPTNTPLPTNTAIPPTAIGTLANTMPFATTVSVNPTSSCNMMSYVNDVTIPDNTPMTPGQTFTKTWKVKNSGTCAWEAGFKFAFTGGDAMSGETYTLTQSVAANAVTEISVAMTAPAKSGSIRGNWRMSTAAGQSFGDEVYVMILIGGAAANTSVPAGDAATATSAPAPTP
jgi:hypothetical protein